MAILQSVLSLRQWHALRTHFLSQIGWQLSRVKGSAQDESGPIPWWSYSCTSFLDQTIPTSWTVLEIGGGASTQWWAQRGNSVTTLETDSEWSIKLRNSTTLFGNRVEILDLKDISVASISQILGNRKFDVVVNDGAGERSIIGPYLNSLRSEQGILIWDNSDRLEYTSGIEELKASGLTALQFFGLSPISAYASKTTVFSQSPLSVRGREVSFNEIDY